MIQNKRKIIFLFLIVISACPSVKAAFFRNLVDHWNYSSIEKSAEKLLKKMTKKTKSVSINDIIHKNSASKNYIDTYEKEGRRFQIIFVSKLKKFRDKDGNTVLHISAQNINWTLMQFFITKEDRLALESVRNRKGRLYLQELPNINHLFERNERYQGSLNEFKQIVQDLLSRETYLIGNIDVNKDNLLMKADREKNTFLRDYILDQFKKEKAINLLPNGDSLLFKAVLNNDMATVQKILQDRNNNMLIITPNFSKKIPAEYRGKGYTPLDLAAKLHNIPMLRTLLPHVPKNEKYNVTFTYSHKLKDKERKKIEDRGGLLDFDDIKENFLHILIKNIHKDIIDYIESKNTALDEVFDILKRHHHGRIDELVKTKYYGKYLPEEIPTIKNKDGSFRYCLNKDQIKQISDAFSQKIAHLTESESDIL